MARRHAHSLPPETLQVMRAFQHDANKRFRKVGASAMVGSVRDDGTFDRAPGRPRGVHTATSSDGATTVLWTAAKDDHRVSRYDIYRDGEKIASVRSATWFSDPDGGQGASYEVRAVDDMGQRSAKAASDGTDDAVSGAAGAAGANAASKGAGALATPQLVAAKPVQKGIVGVAWNPVQGAVAYGIYQDGKLIGHVSSPVFAARVSGKVGFQVDAVAADGSRSKKTKLVTLTANGASASALAGAAAAADPTASALSQVPGNTPAADAVAGAANAAGAQGNQAAASQGQGSTGASTQQQQQATAASPAGAGMQPGMQALAPRVR